MLLRKPKEEDQARMMDYIKTNWIPISGKQYHMMNSKFLSLDASRAQIWTVKDGGSIYTRCK